MVERNWEDLAEKASSETQTDLKKQLEALAKINLSEVEDFLKQSLISRENASKVLKEIEDATKSNSEKALAISTVNKGVAFLVSLVAKLT